MTRRAFAPEIAFLTIGALAGVLFIVVTPPLRGAEESAHWYRAYQVSEGRLVAERQQARQGHNDRDLDRRGGHHANPATSYPPDR